MRKNLLKNFLTVIFLVMCSGYVMSQGVTTASFQGSVIDNAGLTLPGANIVAIHTPSGSRYGSASNEEGRFVIPNVRVGGPYTVTISYIGFDSRVYENINLSLGQNYNLNVELKDGLELDAVEIVAIRGGIMDSDKTGSSLNISNQRLNALPTINRSVGDFTRLTPQSNGNSFAGTSSRFNNFTVDGNVYNNNFGLGSGQFAGGNPISIDAIEEIQVNLAPYDVRQGGFTGAGVNAVTKSGDNTLRGSAYYFLRNDQMQGTKIGENFLPQNDAKNEIAGFRLGGPIIKDKLFFFVSYEKESELRPSILRRAAREGETPDGQFISRVPLSQAEFVRDRISSIYGYDPGAPDSYSFASEQSRFNARLDYNINQNHKLSVRYNDYSSFTDVPTNGNSIRYNQTRYRNTNRTGVESINFRNNNYTNDRRVQSVVAELNSRIGNNMSNQLNIGYTSVTDPKRGIPGGQNFPMIEVLEPDASGNLLYYMTLGNELFTVGNLLENTTLNITNNFSIYKGKHTYTLGGNFEFMTFDNAFNPVFNGFYRYIGYDKFVDAVINQNPNVYPDAFSKGFALDGSTTPPTDATRFGQLGFYIQDEYQVNSKLKVTGGLRVDLPFYPIDIPQNELLNNLNKEFNLIGGGTLKPDVATFPKINPLFSPRIGVNYDVKGDRSFVLRGGTGVFSGRIPFVWLSNQVNGSGVIRGGFGLEGQNVIDNNITFNPDVTAHNPANPSQTLSRELALTDRNFTLPQVWRTNLGVDKLLPGGIVGSFEFIYSRDVSSPIAQNLILRNPEGTLAGPDTRPYWVNQPGLRNYSNDQNFDNLFYLTNAEDKADYVSATVSLEKTFQNGIYLTAAYTLSRARDLDNTGGSQAGSLWTQTVQVDRNRPELSFAQFDQPNRIISTIGYTTKNTTISLLYDGGNAGRFSYFYSGNFGDNAARLIYVPNSASELNFQQYTLGGVDYTPAMQADLFDKYIDQDKYLSTRRGQIAERNGAVRPWVHRFDFSLSQQIDVTKDSKNRLEFRLDFLNVNNLLNSNWGVPDFQWTSNPLLYRGRNASNEPIYRLAAKPGTTEILDETYRKSTDIGNVWRMQIGLRYSFN